MPDEQKNRRGASFSCGGLLLVCLLCLSGGCEEGTATSEEELPRDRPAPEMKVEEDVAMQLMVTQEASALESLRKSFVTAEKAADPLSEERLLALGVISRKAFPEGMTKEVVIAKLEAVANNPGGDAEARANAVGLLLFADSEKGQEYSVNFLRQGSSELKRLLLLTLCFQDEDVPLPITHPALVRELHALIRSPELGHEAMHLCVRSRVPGTREEIWNGVPDAPALLKAEMAFWLTQLELDRRTFVLCSEGLSVPNARAHSRYLTALEQFLDGKDQELAQEVLERMADDLLNLHARQPRNRIDFPQGACAAVLQKGRGPLAGKLVDRILSDPPERDRYLYQQAYSAKRRGEGQDGVIKILEDLASETRSKWACQAIADLYRNSGHPQIAEALWRHIQTLKRPDDLFAFGRILLALGGEKSVERGRALAPRLPEDLRRAFLLEMTKDDPLALANRFMATGFLASNRLAAVLSTIKDYQKENEGDEPAAKMDAHEFLVAAKMVASFDVETDQLPVRHDQLIRTLALISGGVFDPTCCRETFVDETRKRKAFDRPYQVEFIHGDRLYRFVARNFGDWYDLERILIACNKALEDAGAPQRFKELESDGQCASVACITSEQERMLSSHFYISFEKAPNAALGKGKAFESQVKEQLQRP